MEVDRPERRRHGGDDGVSHTAVATPELELPRRVNNPSGDDQCTYI